MSSLKTPFTRVGPFQEFKSCCILRCRLFLRGWLPNTRKSFFIFKNFASCLERRQFLVSSKRFHNIWGFGEIILYAYIISFKTCTVVPFDRSLVCRAIVLICKEMFRTLFASLSREMLVSIYKNIILHSVFLCGFFVFKYRFCAVRTVVCLIMYKI